MALQFITGDLSVNKKQQIIKHLLSIKEKNPQAIIYYLVPEHLKFDMESFVLKEIQKMNKTESSAMIDIQVVSFTRLCWFMLPDYLQKRTSLSDIGLNMLVYQILQDKQDQLYVYRGQIKYQGFIEKLVSLFEELYEGNIEPADLTRHLLDPRENKEKTLSVLEQETVESIVEETLQDGKNQPVLQATDLDHQRLSELELLYQAFIDRIKDETLANYQSYQELSSYLSEFGSMPNHYLVVDHHYYFNAQQLNVLTDLIKVFKDVWITLPLTHREAVSSDFNPMIETPRHTYQQLLKLCQLLRLEVKPDWDLTAPAFDYHPNILQVAQLFKAQQYRGSQSMELAQLEDTLQVWECDTPQTELYHLSNQIHYLVSQKGYRYQDILVLARDMDRYQSFVAPYFDRNRIPYFYDHASTMDQHPFILWLESVLNLKRYFWKYEDLMGVLKSDLFTPEPYDEDADLGEYSERLAEHRHDVQLFENILLANGYFGYRFTQSKFEWRFDQSDQVYLKRDGSPSTSTQGQMANHLRQWVKDKIERPLNQWSNQFTGAQASQWLYRLIIDSGVESQMKRLRDQAIVDGEIETSRRHEQVWQVFVDTLDEFYQLFEDRPIDYDTFCELLLVGLTQATYHIIPPTMDQVTFTNMESPQVQPFKIVFVLGGDDSTLPKVFQQDSLLTQDNREQMNTVLLPHQYLMNQEEARQSLELLLMYQLLVDGTDQVYLSYAVNTQGNAHRMSPYISQLVETLDLKVHLFSGQNRTLSLSEMSTSDFGRYYMQIPTILQGIRHYYEQNEPLPIGLLALIKEMNIVESESQRLSRPLNELIQSIFSYGELPKDLSAKTAIKLFGKDIYASVSRIEQYYQDPYSYFLLYGLKLKERPRFEIDYAKSGDYFHEFLDVFMTKLVKDGFALKDLSSSEFDYYFSQTVTALEENSQYNLFNSHPQLLAIRRQMDANLASFIQFSQKQQSLTKMIPVKTEAIFGLGPSSDYKGFDYHLKSGGKLIITGKIDRVDRRSNPDGSHYLQVIDYKSGKKDHRLYNTYYGLDLQILTYLSVAMQEYPEDIPVGGFYQPLIHSYYDMTQGDISRHTSMDEIQMSKNRLAGYIGLEEDQLSQLDPLLEETNQSLVYPAGLKRDGHYLARSRVVTPDEMNILLEYTHKLFQKAANSMQEGKIQLAPFKDLQFTPSMMPEYRVITGFDATQNYQAYRQLIKYSDKDVIKRMEERLLQMKEGE